MRTLSELIVGTILLSSASTASAYDIRVAYIKGGELWVQDSRNSPRKITSDGLAKGFPVWSVDGEKIAFVRDGGKSSLSDIVVITPSGDVLREIPFRPRNAGTSGMRFVEGLAWPTNSRLMVSGSVNPSTGEYAIVDIASGKQVDGYMADGFSLVPSPDGSHVAYESYIPHFTPEEQRRPQLCFDHECDFGTVPWRGYPGYGGQHLMFLTPPSWSRDNSAVVIVAEDYNTKTPSLILRTLTSKVAAYALPPDAHSPFRLSWSGGTLFVSAGGLAWRLDASASVLTKVSSEVAQDDARAGLQLRSTLEREIQKTGGTSSDFWCASCPLAGLRTAGKK